MNLGNLIRSVRIDELDYAVREAGNPNGQPLVLLHGLMDTGASFEPLVDAMQAIAPDRYRYIAPDWRGHGATTAIHDSYWFPSYLLDLERLLDILVGQDQPVTLIAHSMGGQVASLYAGTRTERVSHLVTLDSLNVPDSATANVPDRYRRWLDAHANPPATKVYDDLQTAASRIAKRYPELNDDVIEQLAAQWTEREDEHGRRRMRVDPWHRVPLPYAFRAAEAKALWREVRAHVLCIDGGDSPAKYFCGEAEMAERRACFSDLRHVVVDGCGHMLHLQKPQSIAGHIAAFLSA
ncbi:haloalkane dehalogenase protein [Salinisphaera shabanensis E1L3A]|uniref:Haloalkane dehalogenase protein n=1 Tax=Salinisphaera shabanensis E1L3A TaxID=1033802 RepID=U2FUY7_9GAMM|nr:alpha/beta hydrolase [Salinisphaera shabanensis]ERJ19744.1 haloalkane dehalogenase protein [Salinisphaera shabanensis E1L3A]